MHKPKKFTYKFNSETLDYDVVQERPVWVKTLIGGLFYMVSSVGLFFLTVYVLADLCHFKDPKTAIIEGRLDEWNSKLEYVNVRFEKLSARLEDMENRY